MNQPNGAPEFKVVLAQYLTKRLHELHNIAHQHGFGKHFIDALKSINESLRRDPRTFGDPSFRLAALKLTVYVRAAFPLVVDYGVHDIFPLVIVRGFRLMI